MRPVPSALCVLLVVGACVPRGLDSNGSDPPDGGGAIGKLYANDPALTVWKQYGKPDRVVLAYTDESGVFDADEQAHRLVPKSSRSATGVSYSHDYGKTWTRVGPIAPAPAGCADPCAIALAGMPALAPNESVPSIVLATLAYTRPDAELPDAIATSATRDLDHWDAPRIAVHMPGRAPSRPSIARRNTTTVMAFTDRIKGEIFLASSQADPPTFAVEAITVGNFADDGAFKDRPIVSLSSAGQAHVAYVIPRASDVSTFDLRVVHAFRQVDMFGGATPWTVSTIFKMDAIAIDPTLPGALGRAWRDAYPYAFAVGDLGKHFYLAYRQRSTSSGLSEIFFVDCDAGDGGNCAIDENGQLTAGWRVRHFPATKYSGGQFMPTLAADPYGPAMSLAWMQETAPGSGSFTVMAMTSTDFSDHLTTPVDLREGNGGAWTPCPTASEIAKGVHSYGERMAQIVVPWDGTPGTHPTFVLAHADSSYGCKDLGELTFDQHIGVATW